MLIYIFAEHYPNPYKPQFDTEFAFLLRSGHDIKIFASGQFITTIHPRVLSYDLHKKVTLFPTTLKTLPRFLGTLLCRVLSSPTRSFKTVKIIYNGGLSLKKNLMRAARALRLPEQEPDLCYVHNIATADNIDFLRQLYPQSRLVMYFHGGEVGGVQRVTRDAELFQSMDVVFTNTNFSRNQAISRGCSPAHVMVLPVGFDLSDYPCVVKKEYRKDGVLRLVSVGRLSEEKGLLYALQALNKLVVQGYGHFTYSIIGCGIQEDTLKAFVRNNGLSEFVAFLGEKDKAGVVSQLEESDVLILPSLITATWAETQAAVVQEAMFMRTLVVATNAGGVPESMADSLKSFAVPVADSDAIAERIRGIMALPEAEMRRLGDSARDFAVNRYNIDLIGCELIRNAMVGADLKKSTAGEQDIL